jgi:hypothetical protein
VSNGTSSHSAIRPTASDDFVSEYTWNFTAAYVTCEPMNDTDWPDQSSRNSRCRNGRRSIACRRTSPARPPRCVVAATAGSSSGSSGSSRGSSGSGTGGRYTYDRAMPTERCPRCGTPRRGDIQVCVRCEHVFGEDVDLTIPRPAAPSPTQSHGTVMAALLSGFVVLAFLLWLSVRGVGPFEARVLDVKPGAGTASVTVEVSNKGSKAGHGKCRIQRLSETGDRGADYQFLSQRVAPKATVTQTVEVTLRAGESAGQVEC